MMPEYIKNYIAVDNEVDETEYGVPHKTRYQRNREAYEEAERGNKFEHII